METEKFELKQKQNREQDVKAEIAAEKRVVEVKEGEKSGLLAVSKQEESTYEVLLENKRQQAAAIRSVLFELRDTSGISFGEAVDYAKAASRRTGVRTAFILGILKQETNLGKNVGTCNRAGDPPEKKWDQNIWFTYCTIFFWYRHRQSQHENFITTKSIASRWRRYK